jgi:hypothetical protein
MKLYVGFYALPFMCMEVTATDNADFLAVTVRGMGFVLCLAASSASQNMSIPCIAQ